MRCLVKSFNERNPPEMLVNLFVNRKIQPTGFLLSGYVSFSEQREYHSFHTASDILEKGEDHVKSS